MTKGENENVKRELSSAVLPCFVFSTQSFHRPARSSLYETIKINTYFKDTKRKKYFLDNENAIFTVYLERKMALREMITQTCIVSHILPCQRPGQYSLLRFSPNYTRNKFPSWKQELRSYIIKSFSKYFPIWAINFLSSRRCRKVCHYEFDGVAMEVVSYRCVIKWIYQWNEIVILQIYSTWRSSIFKKLNFKILKIFWKYLLTVSSASPNRPILTIFWKRFFFWRVDVSLAHYSSIIEVQKYQKFHHFLNIIDNYE